MSSADDISVMESSGNVFADLNVADPEHALGKAELARAISGIIGGRHLTQTEAAELLGIDQPKISAVLRGRLTGFSVDRLLRFLLALDRDVEIVVKPKTEARPHSGLFAAFCTTFFAPKTRGIASSTRSVTPLSRI